MTQRGMTQRVDLRELVAALHELPALVHDRYLTVIAANALARAVSPSFAEGVNLAHSTFLDARVSHGQPGWPALAEHVAASLQESLERNDSDERFRRVVGELAARSRDFSRAFADDASALHHSGVWLFDLPGGAAASLVWHRLAVPGLDDVLLVWRPADAAAERALAALARSNA